MCACAGRAREGIGSSVVWGEGGGGWYSARARGRIYTMLQDGTIILTVPGVRNDGVVSYHPHHQDKTNIYNIIYSKAVLSVSVNVLGCTLL